MSFIKTKQQMVGFLLLIGILLHFTRLSSPRSVIFDEVHFGKFVSSYCCTGTNIFDIHPPHAKLLIAGAAKLGGYDGNFDFARISEDYEKTPIFAFRFFPAVWGTFLPIAFFYVLLLMGVSQSTAFFGGLLLAFDNAFLLQTRVIALDGLLLLATLCSLGFYLAARNAVSWKKQILLWILTGASVGFAIGTKFTGLVVPLLLGILILSEHWTNWKVEALLATARKIIWITASFLVVYLSGWVLHFRLLDKPGTGDPFYKYTGNFPLDLINLHRVMLERNATITTPHSDASYWWQWPTMNRSIYYWQGFDSDIYYLGNPVVWWGSVLVFCIAILFLIRSFLPSKQPQPKNWWMLFGLVSFLAAYLPFVEVRRPLFLYHFLTPLLFAMMTGLIWFDWKFKNQIYKRFAMAAILVVVLGGFVMMSPITFGFQGSKPWEVWVLKRLPRY